MFEQVKGSYTVNIRKIREEEGLTCSQLAERVGVKASTIHKIEIGRYCPNVFVALLIANVLSVPLDSLYWLDDEPVHDLQKEK
jgi:DNA-binding XRE family transcriptional regulator